MSRRRALGRRAGEVAHDLRWELPVVLMSLVNRGDQSIAHYRLVGALLFRGGPTLFKPTDANHLKYRRALLRSRPS